MEKSHQDKRSRKLLKIYQFLQNALSRTSVIQQNLSTKLKTKRNGNRKKNTEIHLKNQRTRLLVDWYSLYSEKKRNSE